jgi:hypothetical protein
MRTIETIKTENKALEKELRSIQKKIDENISEYEKAVNELTKQDLLDAKEKIQNLYGGVASITLNPGTIKIHFKKTENYTRAIYPIKAFIEEKLNKSGMFNIRGENQNSYGEYKTLILSLTKKYLKEFYNL